MGQLRLDLPDEIYRKLKILAAMRGTGGVKPECEEAARYWLALHTDKDGNLITEPRQDMASRQAYKHWKEIDAKKPQPTRTPVPREK